MTFWREASTLILALRTVLSDGSSKLSSRPSSAAYYKVLMLRRSARSSFMPSKLVFPGGVVQDADSSGDWNAVFEKVLGRSLSDMNCQTSSSTASGYLHNTSLDNWALPSDVAYRICAIRETFEESGLLLATNRELLSPSRQPFVVSHSASELTKPTEDERRKVEQNPEYFMQMCMDLGVVPDVWALHVWRNWLTPVFRKVSAPSAKPKRFNTMFFVCCVDCNSVPLTVADEGETTQAEVSLMRYLYVIYALVTTTIRRAFDMQLTAYQRSLTSQ